MSNLRNIVIVGGDFACTTLARALERQRLPGHRVVLISEESYTTFNPMLSEVVGASVFPEHVVAPMRQMLRPQSGSQFVMGRVSGVDFERRPVHASTLAGVRQIAYEHLVLAFGSRANLDLLPGLAQHALPLKLVGDAMHIRNRVLQRVAAIELETDPVARRRLGRFIVIGGGFSSVEVAGAIHDVLRGVARYYPRVQPDELAVTLLENGDRLLPELAPSLGRAATRSVRARHRRAPGHSGRAGRGRRRGPRHGRVHRRRDRRLHDRDPAESAAGTPRAAGAARPSGDGTRPGGRRRAAPVGDRRLRVMRIGQTGGYAAPTAQAAVARA